MRASAVVKRQRISTARSFRSSSHAATSCPNSSAESIRRSFRRRSTQIPEGAPEGLSASFVEDPLSTGRWRAFIKKGKLTEASADLSDVVARIRSFALPAREAARDNLPFPKHWPPGGPWRARTRSKR